ncbi:phosphatase [Emydomyces testavorans]|uniref:Phosphatase n=1 Tax=Emydomyces testavorans TaxID=2070801 RepID=A0AAF0IH34_9EURO|nr:phosphatase [Emydomyces testavorans]
MSLRESSSTSSNLREAPGAFPDQPDDEEDAQVASDFKSLSRAVHARRTEYTRQRKVKLRIGSWNVAALPGTEEDLRKWFTTSAVGNRDTSDADERHEKEQEQSSREAPDDGDGNETSRAEAAPVHAPEGSVDIDKNDDQTAGTVQEDTDIFVLGLQEIVDITSPTETLRPYVDPTPSNKWKEAAQKMLPAGYILVSSQQLTGLLLLIYASQSIASSISSVSSTSVGTGLMGYMGNKGAVATRLVLGGTTCIVFVNCHLAAGADKASLDRRNWDASQVAMRTRFDPFEDEDDLDLMPNQTLGDEDFAFWFGDLNYRLEGIPGDDVRRLLHMHTENDFGPLPKAAQNDEASNIQESNRSSTEENASSESPAASISMVDNEIEPYQDPASLETTLTSLLPHDELRAQQKKRKAFFEGWREGQIRFLPTYKYDVGRTGEFDSSEKRRSPSWCDRTLYRTRQDYLEYKRRTKEAEETKRRDNEMRSLGLDQEAEDTNVLFDYDPEFDGADYDENEDADDDIFVDTHQERDFEDLIDITCYTSHQNIVSSDHKPLHADFILTYDAVIQELKARVHQEVARELDKAENEARPDITLVVDELAERSEDAKPAANGDTDRDTISFGQIRYDVPVSRSLTLANTGSVPATFSFQYRPVAADEDTRVSPPWLHLRVDWPANEDAQAPNAQKEYALPTGESAHVQLVLCIFDVNFVRELNTGKAELEDVLVLRVSNGRDHFISVRGDWLPSCFGLSLEELTRIPEGGVRNLDVTRLLSDSSGDTSSDNVRASAPRELFRLTEAIAELTERSIAEWDMVGDGDDTENNARPWLSERAGWPFDSETWTFRDNLERYKLLGLIREGLDTSTAFFSQFPHEVPSRHRAELLAEILLSFLGSLHDGLITRALWTNLENQIFVSEKPKSAPLSTEQAQSRILETLSSSPVHSVSFTFLTFMLNRIANEIAPIIPITFATPTSPTNPTTPSLSSISRASTDLSEASNSSIPTSPSLPTATRSSLTFPFRFKTRSLTLSSSDGNATPIPQPRPPTSNAAYCAHNAALARRRAVNKAFVQIFANVIFSKDIPVPEKDKEKRVFEERKRSVIEPFLRGEDGS